MLAIIITVGFPGGSDGKESARNAGELGSILGWEDPLRRKWQPTLGFLPKESHRERSLVGYSPWGCRESDMTERLTHTHTHHHHHHHYYHHHHHSIGLPQSIL